MIRFDGEPIEREEAPAVTKVRARRSREPQTFVTPAKAKMGRPRIHASSADRQRAYRQRVR